MSDKLEAALHDGYPAATASLVAAVRAQVKAERERDEARAALDALPALIREDSPEGEALRARLDVILLPNAKSPRSLPRVVATPKDVS